MDYYQKYLKYKKKYLDLKGGMQLTKFRKIKKSPRELFKDETNVQSIIPKFIWTLFLNFDLNKDLSSSI